MCIWKLFKTLFGLFQPFFVAFKRLLVTNLSRSGIQTGVMSGSLLEFDPLAHSATTAGQLSCFWMRNYQQKKLKTTKKVFQPVFGCTKHSRSKYTTVNDLTLFVSFCLMLGGLLNVLVNAKIPLSWPIESRRLVSSSSMTNCISSKTCS